MSFPLVRELAAEGIPVRLTCGVLGFSPQAFYQWRAKPVSDRDWSDAHVLNAIVEIHADDPEFGYRFIADELDRGGHDLGEGRVHRLCRENRVWSSTTKKGRRGSGRFRGRRCTTTWCVGTSARITSTRSGSPTSPSIRPRGQGLRVCDQGPLLEPDRGLLDR